MFSSIFRDFNEDPVFRAHSNHMRQMEPMFADPFGMLMRPPALMAPGQQTDSYQRDHGRRGERQVAMRGMFDPFGDPFGMHSMMSSMMGNMHREMLNPALLPAAENARNNPNAHFYSSSTVMSYSNDGRSQPKVFQASTSTTQTGGMKETRKAVRDSESGVQKMSVGRHVNDRAHIITREKNVRTGDEEENVDLINLDEGELDSFNREFQQRAPHGPTHHQRSLHHGRSRHTPAIEGASRHDRGQERGNTRYDRQATDRHSSPYSRPPYRDRE